MSSLHPAHKPVTLKSIARAVAAGERFACLTCYDASMARLLQRVGVPLLLVGDTAAEVVLGFDRTIHMPLELQIALTAGVKRGAPGCVVMGDMPFMSYQTSADDAMRHAGRFMTEGRADIIKVEADANTCAARGSDDAGGYSGVRACGQPPAACRDHIGLYLGGQDAG
jgi:3-methyl-2-oxobutanoate hydroxymethyltransferase